MSNETQSSSPVRGCPASDSPGPRQSVPVAPVASDDPLDTLQWVELQIEITEERMFEARQKVDTLDGEIIALCRVRNRLIEEAQRAK